MNIINEKNWEILIDINIFWVKNSFKNTNVLLFLEIFDFDTKDNYYLGDSYIDNTYYNFFKIFTKQGKDKEME